MEFTIVSGVLKVIGSLKFILKEMICLIIFAEVLRAISICVLIISSSFYFRHLAKTKKQRKLSTIELTMYTIIYIAYAFLTISIWIFILVE